MSIYNDDELIESIYSLAEIDEETEEIAEPATFCKALNTVKEEIEEAYDL